MSNWTDYKVLQDADIDCHCSTLLSITVNVGEVIEDALWHDFGETSNHMVPHLDGKLVKETLASGDVLIRLQTNIGNDGGRNTGNRGLESNGVLWAKEDIAICPSRINADGSLPHASNQVVPPASGFLSAVNNIVPLTFQDGQISDKYFNQYNVDAKKCGFGAKNLNVMTEETLDKNEYCSFSLSTISSADNGLTYFENDKAREDDLLYYDLPDISNFEDIDKFFSSDPTFGEPSDIDSQSWFSSSSKDIYVSENSQKTSSSGLASSTQELSAINSTFIHPIANSLTRNDPPVSNKQSHIYYHSFKLDSASEQTSDVGEKTGLLSSVTQVFNENSYDNSNNFNMGKNQPQSCRSSRSVSIPSHAQQFAEQKQFPSCFTSLKANSSQLSGKHGGYMDSEFSSYLPTFNPPLQVQGASHFEEDLYMHTVSRIANNDVKLQDIVEKSGLGLLEQTTSSWNQPTSQQDVGRNSQLSVEHKTRALDAFAVYNSSSMLSVYSDDISGKAISFKQLQDVMGQLDVTTKLCIRDSLYRLARSAEQRHNFATSNGGTEYRKGAYGTKEHRNSGGRLNVETETNPIDRSIARLLFHRPSEIGTKPADDPILLESHMITEQINGPISDR